MKERIAKITERWFLSEEPLFSVFCTHRVVENRDMKCCARVGKGLVEVNPVLDVRNQTAVLAVALAARLLGEKIY